MNKNSSIHLLAFGGTKPIIGSSEVEFPLDSPCLASDLLDKICGGYSQLASQRNALRLAVNGTYVDGNHTIVPGDEVALIPPVAGG